MDYQNRYNLPEELVPLVDRELTSGESVAWVGQPIPSRLARAMLPSVLFGIPWTAFAIFWTVMASGAPRQSGSSGWLWVFPLWGVPFILIGFGMLSSPYWVLRRARRTAYVLTNQRAIVMSIGWRGKTAIRSFEPDALKDLRRNERSDGSGDLIFAEDVSPGNRGRDRVTNAGFLAIKEVKNVEEQVRQLIRKKMGSEI
jgi:hypothetical protein